MTSPLDALNRARAAWEATQPQLVLDGWADALDDTDPCGGHRVGVIERTPLNPCGTEPHSDRRLPAAATGSLPHASPLCSVGASVPHHLNNDGPVRIPGERMRGRGQGG